MHEDFRYPLRAVDEGKDQVMEFTLTLKVTTSNLCGGFSPAEAIIKRLNKGQVFGVSGVEVISCEEENQDITVAAVLTPGTLEIHPGQTGQEVLNQAGESLDACSAWDIIGDTTFLGSDGKVYWLPVEAEITETSDVWLDTIVEEKADLISENAIRCAGEYGYEVLSGGGYSLVGLGWGKPLKAKVVETNQVLHRRDLGEDEWAHPDFPCPFCDEDACNFEDGICKTKLSENE